MKNEGVQPQTYTSIIGNNYLQNYLLIRFLKSELNRECGCYQTVDEFRREINRKKDWIHLVLWDCKNFDISGIWQTLEDGFRSSSNRFLIALFNVDHRLKIEQEAVGRGLRGLFYEEESIENIIKGILMIMDGQLWFSRDTMSKYVQMNTHLDNRTNMYPILTGLPPINWSRYNESLTMAEEAKEARRWSSGSVTVPSRLFGS